MVEYWDLYDKNRNKISKIVKRGDKLLDNEYHLVINAWIRNSNNEFLITQRSANKKFAFMWECTGGSALKGENSLQAAIREIKEELGIKVDEKTGKLIGTTLRQYSGCPDILDVWVFESDASIEDVVVQESEVCDVMWASVEKIKELYEDNKFEANAFFEEAISYLSEDIYYIGFNANNAICNDSFFKGSITLYPTLEKGNIYYSAEKIEDTNSDNFMKKYREYIYVTTKKIQAINSNSKFICFNEKIRKLCINMTDINIVKSNDSKLLDFLNNKFKTRYFVKDCVPILEYHMLDKNDLSYEKIKEKIGSDKFVIQSETGSGGNSTYLISCPSDMQLLQSDNSNYCVSKYIKNLPLNITLIIGDDEIIFLPISVQLILLIENRFRYVGGDFCYAQRLDNSIKKKLNEYSLKIAKKVQNKGYRGVLGLDFILHNNNKLAFMEINPRFQSSSFLISMYLQKMCSTTVAELHYQALINRKLKQVNLDEINQSFVNCNEKEEFKDLINFKIITKGYFRENPTSNYRKVFNYSILHEDKFEKN